MKDNHKKIYLLLLVLAILVNLAGINSRFFTDDPGLYGSIAKQLIYKHDFFQLFSYGRDWLDKPHLPFWLTMFSYKLFGIYSWTYRLPALLCFLLSLWYTWLLAKKYYGVDVAMMAVLILSTALHLMMSNTDVRAEPYLMAFIIGSIYHIARLDERFSIIDLLLAALLIAFAIMTKGVFVIVAIGGSLLGQLLFQKRFKDLFQIKWLGLILLTILFTAPELYALYIQFDRHPEKTVFGRHGVSGIKWFLWDSQFGRFTNNGPINRKQGDVFFFIHTLLWAFAPWCLVYFYSVYKIVRDIFKRRPQPEYFVISGASLLWLLFSLSGFQLPFYTNILFPLFAVITARFFNEQLNRNEDRFRRISQWLYIVLLPVAVIGITVFLRPGSWFWPIVSVSVLITLAVLILTSNSGSAKHVFMLSCAVMIFVNLYLNTVLYPVIIENKGQLKAADYVNQPVFANCKLYSVMDQNNIFQFYADSPVELVTLQQFTAFKAPQPNLFYLNQETMDALAAQKATFKVVQTFQDYPQENIIPDFINHETRGTTLQPVYLIIKL